MLFRSLESVGSRSRRFPARLGLERRLSQSQKDARHCPIGIGHQTIISIPICRWHLGIFRLSSLDRATAQTGGERIERCHDGSCPKGNQPLERGCGMASEIASLASVCAIAHSKPKSIRRYLFNTRFITFCLRLI